MLPQTPKVQGGSQPSCLALSNIVDNWEVVQLGNLPHKYTVFPSSATSPPSTNTCLWVSCIPFRMPPSAAQEKSPALSRKQVAAFLFLSLVLERLMGCFSSSWDVERGCCSSSDSTTLASPFCLVSLEGERTWEDIIIWDHIPTLPLPQQQRTDLETQCIEKRSGRLKRQSLRPGEVAAIQARLSPHCYFSTTCFCFWLARSTRFEGKFQFATLGTYLYFYCYEGPSDIVVEGICMALLR